MPRYPSKTSIKGQRPCLWNIGIGEFFRISAVCRNFFDTYAMSACRVLLLLGLGLTANAMAQSGTYSNISEYSLPITNLSPHQIIAGPDGALCLPNLVAPQ